MSSTGSCIGTLGPELVVGEVMELWEDEACWGGGGGGVPHQHRGCGALGSLAHVLVFFCFPVCTQNVICQLPAPAFHAFPACCCLFPAKMDSSPLEMVANGNASFPELLLAVEFYLSNRELTNTAASYPQLD